MFLQLSGPGQPGPLSFTPRCFAVPASPLNNDRFGRPALFRPPSARARRAQGLTSTPRGLQSVRCCLSPPSVAVACPPPRLLHLGLIPPSCPLGSLEVRPSCS